MLTSIRIRNLALIDDLEIGLDGGLTVLTGETGAGKSIIVGALNLVLGDRASADLIRQGVPDAEVEALFELDPTGDTQTLLADMGLAEPDGTLVVRRVVARAGKNRVYLNGRLATLSDLKRVVGPLVDISSQHEHTSLLKVGQHREILDRFGDLGRVRVGYAEAYSAWRAAATELERLVEADGDRAERIEFLRFQLAEIDEVDPVENEETDLLIEQRRLQHVADLRDAADAAQDRLSGAVRALVAAEQALRAASDADPEVQALAMRVEASRIEVDDIEMETGSYLTRAVVDPYRLEVVSDRIADLRRLMRRHGAEISDVIARRETLCEELETLSNRDDRLGELQADVADKKQAATWAAATLSDARKTIGRKATKAVEAQLADLGMPKARFDVSIELLDDLAWHGRDRVELLLSSNVGEEPLPLARIASGGELSRIMLALKHVLAAADTVDCYVFDEVDSGVSGSIADRIGLKLRETAGSRQALCITHLPQVACHAHQQLRVHKEVVDGRTVTRVSVIAGDQRLEEIARLLAGAAITDEARAHAEQMLKNAS